LININEYVSNFESNDPKLLKNAVLKLIYASMEDNAKVVGNKMYLNNIQLNEDEILIEDQTVN